MNRMGDMGQDSVQDDNQGNMGSLIHPSHEFCPRNVFDIASVLGRGKPHSCVSRAILDVCTHQLCRRRGKYNASIRMALSRHRNPLHRNPFFNEKIRKTSVVDSSIVTTINSRQQQGSVPFPMMQHQCETVEQYQYHYVCTMYANIGQKLCICPSVQNCPYLQSHIKGGYTSRGCTYPG